MCDKGGDGVKQSEIFADVINGSSLSHKLKIILGTIL